MRFLALALLVVSNAVADVPQIDAPRILAERDLPGLPVAEQRRLLDALAHGNGPYGRFLATYFVPKEAPELAWVNPAMRDRLYRMNVPGSESNCYWTSHFSLGVLGLPERFMDLPEYERLAETYYDRYDPATSAPQAGDVLRLRRQRGNMDTHSVPYLGRLRSEYYTELVISKDGPSDGPYLIMSLSELAARVYPGSRVTDIYRRR